MDIDKLISEAFVRHKAEERMTFQSLVEMVSQVMFEDDERDAELEAHQDEVDADGEGFNAGAAMNPRAPKEVWATLEDILKQLQAIFKDNKKAPQYKKGDSGVSMTAFENTGNALHRDEAVKKIAAFLKSQNIPFDLTVPYRKQDPSLGFIGGTFEVGGIQHKFVLKKGSGGSGGNLATQFEGNILVGLLGGFGTTAGNELFAKLGETGDVVDTGDPKKNAFQEKANEIAAALKKVPAFPKGKLDLGSSSGGKVTATLTKPYKEHGVTSTEAKADVEINAIGVSVKKLEESQFVSAQGPELAAIFDVAMRRNRELKGTMENSITTFVDQLQRATGSDFKAHAAPAGAKYKTKTTGKNKGEQVPNLVTGDEGGARGYQTRGDIAKAAQQDPEMVKKYGNKKGKLSQDAANVVYQKQLNQLIFLDKGKGLPQEEKDMLIAAAGNLGAATQDSFVKTQGKVKSILQSGEFRSELVKECVTGLGKFNEAPPRAVAILKWSMDTPEKSDFVMLTSTDEDTGATEWKDDYFMKIASNAKIEIRDRGDSRGLGLRGEFGEEPPKDGGADLKESQESAFNVNDIVFTDEETNAINEHTDVIYNKMIGDGILTEGLQDWIGGAVDLAKKGAGWIADKAKWVAKAVAGVIARFAGWVKKLWNKGFSYLAEFFGFEPVGMKVAI